MPWESLRSLRSLCSASFTAFVVLVLGLVIGSSACSTTKSFVQIPACAQRVEVEGQATQVSKNTFELDHTFDLPFSRTELAMKTPAGERTFEIVDSQPDTLRLFAGAASGVIGGALLAAAFYNVTAEQQGFFTAIPFYETVFGAGALALGVVGMGTGWHPAARVFRFPDDVCPDQPAYPARKKPKRAVRVPAARPRATAPPARPSMPTSPPAVPPTPPPLEPSAGDGTYER